MNSYISLILVQAKTDKFLVFVFKLQLASKITLFISIKYFIHVTSLFSLYFVYHGKRYRPYNHLRMRLR